jgi:hypothetical protein
MIAVVTKIQFKKDEVEDAIKDYQEHIIPSRHLRKGSQGGYLLVDRKTGKAINISFWENEDYHGDGDNETQYMLKKDIFKKHFESFEAPFAGLHLFEVCTQG